MALLMTDAEVLTLTVGEIVAHPAIQQRVSMDREKVAEYAELYGEGRDLGRLVVFQTDEGLLLADGFHRLEAARTIGLHTLPCTVSQGSQRDAILFATSCNLHGKALSNQDKRKRVTTLLTDPEWSSWSDNHIARHCGVAQSFVSKLRHDMSLNSEISEETTSPSLNSEISDKGIDVSLHSEIRENGPVPTRRTYTNRYGQVSTMNTRAIGQQGLAPPPEAPVRDPAGPEGDEADAPATQPEVQDPAPPEAAAPRQDVCGVVEALVEAWNGGDRDTVETLMDALTDHEDLKLLSWTHLRHALQFYKIAAWYWQEMADASLAAIETVVDRLSALATYEAGEAEQQQDVAWLRDQGVTDPTPWETDPAWFANPDISGFVHDTLETTPHYMVGVRKYCATLREQDQGEPAQLALAKAPPAPVPQPEPPPSAEEERQPDPVAPSIPPYDASKFQLGKLCANKHEWGQTGQTLRRINGRGCQQCDTEKKRQQYAPRKERYGD